MYGIVRLDGGGDYLYFVFVFFKKIIHSPFLQGGSVFSLTTCNITPPLPNITPTAQPHSLPYPDSHHPPRTSVPCGWTQRATWGKFKYVYVYMDGRMDLKLMEFCCVSAHARGLYVHSE